MSDGAFTKEAFLSMEHRVLALLRFNLTVPTVRAYASYASYAPR